MSSKQRTGVTFPSDSSPSSSSDPAITANSDSQPRLRQHWPHTSRDRNLSTPGESSSGSSPPFSAPPGSQARLPERTNLPTRSSTLGSPKDLDKSKNTPEFSPSSLNDLDRTPITSPRTPMFNPHSPTPDWKPKAPTSPPHVTNGLPSISRSDDGAHSPASSLQPLHGSSKTPPPNSGPFSPSNPLICSSCKQIMTGQFVRALGAVFHLECFRCEDCNEVVAQKFFTMDAPDGKQYPLCETDYFRRLGLICGKCNMALRGSYITACNKKYHVEHFTCSICPTVFGPSDSYYEHEGEAFCHYHYSTRFATKCVGCNSAILKQFVEINRNMKDECWHPECYMIHKFWNVKLSSRAVLSPSVSTESLEEPPYIREEQLETPASLKEKQIVMEKQVFRIWSVLSAFEESSAACISDMLRQVSNGHYLEAIRMAEKFILHVEVLFATIDDLEACFAKMSAKGMSHVREARMLCRKTVDLFTLLSQTQEAGSRRTGMTQELLALVTGLAHYLKILIRIALTGALKLDRDHGSKEPMSDFLDKLDALARRGGNPSAKRLLSSTGETRGTTGTRGVAYGFKSLAPENAGDSPFSGRTAGGPPSVAFSHPPSDLCSECKLNVEEDCVRLGTYQRRHSHCVKCKTCGKLAAAPPTPKEVPKTSPTDAEKDKAEPPKISTARRPPANVGEFVFQEVPGEKGPVLVIYCLEHCPPGSQSGFQAVSRLEQYAFLLNVALRRLYMLLQKRGLISINSNSASSSTESTARPSSSDSYRDYSDVMKTKSVRLDRKLSATARLPKRSTIVESPAGRVAQPTDVQHSQRNQENVPVPKLPPQHQQSAAASSNGRTTQSSAPVNESTSNSPPIRPPLQPPTLRTGESSTGSSTLLSTGERVIRPSFARNNTEVMIVDDSAPLSPGTREAPPPLAVDDSITLADIPQIMEQEQAREQHRSLPSLGDKPLIAELTPLELAIIKHCAVLALSKSHLKELFDLDEMLELVELKKSGFWNNFKLFKNGDKSRNVKKKGVFGVPLEQLVEREGSDSMLGASRTTLRVPSFLDDVISAMRQMDMSVEGIFRRNGNIRRLKELTDAIDRDPASVDLTADNPVQLAALLKKFLRDLPDPLLTFKLHRLFIASQSAKTPEEAKRLLHMILIILPKCNRDAFEVLCVFLKWVASFAHVDEETGSKMDLPNLATVICPSILYSKGRDIARDESFGAIRVVTELLENQDDFYTVPDEFLTILDEQDYFTNVMEMSSKDFLKKCETFMKLRANGRPAASGMTSPISASTSSPIQGKDSGSSTPAILVPRRPDSADVRLVPQRSDPALSRGRPADNRLQSPRQNHGHDSHSLERPTSSYAAQNKFAPHPGLPHQPFSQPAPSSLANGQSYNSMSQVYSPTPRHPESRSQDMEWSSSQGASPIPSRPGSRPVSYARPNVDHSFSQNGRHSPVVPLRGR
ncbi:RhoGAP-domain-containing protein [Sistotremastrum niveocremeum HHB9708]|uniref:RhoGAP-domain-containing protein n=2 Tax=Sistotremastraceae TaxID=3402574 RepID=A0A164VXL6_9AGAM|nr:RhoGAP-domain-containing protein [Sistotremastrum niveocremeum HHB9708]KZT43231.1 RhoGAP-domain-containing protein [Sistotremastrum suecicum HHB10207 ss-3]